MLLVLLSFLSCSVDCVRSLVMALSGCVVCAVVDVQNDVVLYGFRGWWMGTALTGRENG
jgi:hypothetical protein